MSCSVRLGQDHCGREYFWMFAGTGILGLPRGSATGVCDIHFMGMTPVHPAPSYSSSGLMAKPVRTLAEASTSGTERTMVPFNSCSVGGRTAAQRPRMTYSTKSRANAHIVCWHDEGQAVSKESDVANEGFIQYAVNQFAIVAAAFGLAMDL